MSNQFNIGDVVKLKSSTFKMTVTALGKDGDGNPRATCQWIDTAGQEHTAVYPLSAIVAVEPLAVSAARVRERLGHSRRGSHWSA